jgi:hypothetical protein
MGKVTQYKNEQKLLEEQKLMASFTRNNQSAKAKMAIPVAPLHQKILCYREFFINDPVFYQPKTKSKDPQKQLQEIVRHAFAKYPVCHPLKSVWEDVKRANNYQSIDFKLWYICVANGGSLYKTYAKEHLSKKEVHCLTTCPHNLTIEQAMVYSVAKAESNNEGVALRIAKTKLTEKPFTAFWKTVMRFFAKNPTTSLSDINDLLDYIQERLRQNPDFSMAGNTVEVLQKRMQDWHYELRRIKVLGDSKWTGTYIPDDSFITKDSMDNEYTWTFTQILSSKVLAEEGNKMHHCVFSYKKSCVEGKISIWSLKKSDMFGIMKPKVTIEIGNDGTIRQARGFANRSMKGEESHVVNMWVAKNGLHLPAYLY